MNSIASAVAEGDQYPRMMIYNIYPHQLYGLLTGKARITNLPEGFKIYKVVPFEPDQCDNSLCLWVTHPSFDEVPWGNLVPSNYLYWEDIKE